MANKYRRDVQLQVGDKVLVKLHPYRQMSVAEKSFSKLRRRYYGPFIVLKKVGLVAYKLDLPPNSRIHSVFHISKLKLYKEDINLHPQPLPTEVIEGKLIVQPLAILRQRWVIGRKQDQLQILVQWKDLPPEEATWMTIQEFQEGYPTFDLEGKVNLEGEGNVTAREHDEAPVYRRRKTKT